MDPRVRLLALLLLAVPAQAQEWITVPPPRPQAPDGFIPAGPPAGDPSPAAETTVATTAQPGTALLAPGGVVRVLDKINGTVTDLTLANGETAEVGMLTVTMGECRAPALNPTGDAYQLLSIRTLRDETAVFEGWMIAAAPALNAMDHPRYDVWALRCTPAGG